jgi:hypothetical protein
MPRKTVAERYDIRPGDDLPLLGATARLELFDEATRRLDRRKRKMRRRPPATRGWTREDLYRRGGPR